MRDFRGNEGGWFPGYERDPAFEHITSLLAKLLGLLPTPHSDSLIVICIVVADLFTDRNIVSYIHAKKSFEKSCLKSDQ